jgi:hypothetical protein
VGLDRHSYCSCCTLSLWPFRSSRPQAVEGEIHFVVLQLPVLCLALRVLQRHLLAEYSLDDILAGHINGLHVHYTIRYVNNSQTSIQLLLFHSLEQQTVSTSYAMCEALRLAAVWLLPLWWHARRGAFPPKDLKENFGNQVLSLVVSLYTLATLATVRCA